MNKSLAFLILFLLILNSCTRYKNLVILQATKEDSSAYSAKSPEYRIQKRDVLYIRVNSMNLEITQAINANVSLNSNSFTNDATLFIYGYNVSDSGYIELPIIGKIPIEGKTLEEAKRSVEHQAAVYLKDATVIVKLLSFKYSVLGEVLNPGVFQNYNNQLTVLEAISNAGDISPYGNRHKIMVVRSTPSGTETFRLDLTSTQILASDGYFLLPNDVVYVEPIRSYNFKVNIPTITLFLTTITTLILVLNYIDTN